MTSKAHAAHLNETGLGIFKGLASHTASVFAAGEVDPQSSGRKETESRTDICFAATSRRCRGNVLMALSCKHTLKYLLDFLFFLLTGGGAQVLTSPGLSSPSTCVSHARAWSSLSSCSTGGPILHAHKHQRQSLTTEEPKGGMFYTHLAIQRTGSLKQKR